MSVRLLNLSVLVPPAQPECARSSDAHAFLLSNALSASSGHDSTQWAYCNIITALLGCVVGASDAAWSHIVCLLLDSCVFLRWRFVGRQNPRNAVACTFVWAVLSDVATLLGIASGTFGFRHLCDCVGQGGGSVEFLLLFSFLWNFCSHPVEV